MDTEIRQKDMDEAGSRPCMRFERQIEMEDDGRLDTTIVVTSSFPVVPHPRINEIAQGLKVTSSKVLVQDCSTSGNTRHLQAGGIALSPRDPVDEVIQEYSREQEVVSSR